MNQMLTQINDAGGSLVLLIPPILQILKKIPFLVKLQKADIPAYELLSLGLGVAGAFALGIPNAIVVGIVSGLAAGKGYDFVVNNKDSIPKVDTTTIAKTIVGVVPILALACLLLLFTGCAESVKVQPAAWLLSGANVQSADSENQIEDTLEYIGRVGVLFEPNEPAKRLLDGGTEVGLASDWWTKGTRQFYGVYALRFLTQDPNGLLGRPYVGAQATLDVKEQGGMYGFMTGTVFDSGGFDIVTEFQARTYNDTLKQQAESADRYKGYLGLRIPF